MKRAFVTILVLMLGVVVARSADDRVWTDKKGNQVKAELFAAYGPLAFFDAGRRRYMRFPINHLIDSDQEFIIKWAVEHEEERIQRPDVTAKNTTIASKSLSGEITGKTYEAKKDTPLNRS